MPLGGRHYSSSHGGGACVKCGSPVEVGTLCHACWVKDWNSLRGRVSRRASPIRFAALRLRWRSWPWLDQSLPARARRAWQLYDSYDNVGDNCPPPGPILYCDAENRIINDWAMHRQDHPDHSRHTRGMRAEWFPPELQATFLEHPFTNRAADAAEDMGIRGGIVCHHRPQR